MRFAWTQAGSSIWKVVQRIPAVYREAVLDEKPPVDLEDSDDANCLATLPNYRSLMPMAQDLRASQYRLTLDQQTGRLVAMPNSFRPVAASSSN